MDKLFIDFLNTAWHIKHDTCADPLESSEWLASLLARIGRNPVLDGHDADRWIGLRAELAAIVDRLIAEGTPQEADLDWLNGKLKGHPVTWHISRGDTGYEMSEKTDKAGPEHVEYLIIQSLAVFIAGGNLASLHRCGNGDCRWLFLDHSKSHTRKWCSNTCASLIKVRRHRAGKSKLD